MLAALSQHTGPLNKPCLLKLVLLLPDMSRSMDQPPPAGVHVSVSNELPELPDHVLVLVLRHVPQQQRLGSCARVQRRWQAAAVAASTSIQARLWSATHHAGLHGYLLQHGNLVTALEVTTGRFDTFAGFELQRLPCPQLQQLQLQGLWLRLAAAADRRSILQDCTALSRLCIHDCVAKKQPGSLAGALSHLCGLQHLSFERPSGYSQAPLPAGSLQSLVQLTHVGLSGIMLSNDCFVDICGLPRLRALHLSMGGQDVTAAGLQEGSQRLAPCLSDLQLDRLQFSISASTLPGLSRLTSLRHLDLKCSQLEPAVFACCITQLQHLRLSLQSPLTSAQEVGAVLAWTAQLTQITHLDLCGCLQAVAAGTTPPGASSYSALTASTKLQVLNISDCALPAGVWEHLFPAGRLLPKLHSLNLDLGDLAEETQLGAAGLDCLVECCPNLVHLDLGSDLPQPGTPCSALRSLSHLQSLKLGHIDSAAAEQVAHLAGLTTLYVDWDQDTLDPEGGAKLLALTNLRRLCVGVRDMGAPPFFVRRNHSVIYRNQAKVSITACGVTRWLEDSNQLFSSAPSCIYAV